MLNWGIIGASTIAKEWMIDAVNANAKSRVIALLSQSQQRGKAFQKQFEIDRIYTELSAFLADTEIDIVYVGTTNELHKPQTLAAAASKKHVLCEKPLALSLTDAKEMVNACSNAGLVMGTNHHLRNAVTHRKLRKLVQNGAIGQPLAVRVFHAVLLPPHLRTWRIKDPGKGAGVVLDITVHDTDTLRFILNDEVESVIARTSSQGLGEHKIDETVMGVMQFRRGTLAQFHDSFVIGHSGTGLEIHGTDGSLIATDVMTQHPIGQITFRRENHIEKIQLPQAINLYKRAVDRFNEAVRGEGQPAATAQDGLQSLAVALAVMEAAHTGTQIKVNYA